MRSQIKNRLENDIGGLIDLIKKERETGHDWFPWWSLFRATMPIAESIGDLIYRDSEANNLIKVFQKEFARERSSQDCHDSYWRWRRRNGKET